MKNVAAFFDIDGTLSRDSLMIEHFKMLMKYNIIDSQVWYSELKPLYDRYDKRFANYEIYLETLSKVYSEKIKGMNKFFNEFIAKQVIENHGDRVYRYTRNRIKHHIERGHFIFFISGSPDFLVERIALKYNAKSFKGSTYIVDEHASYTGEVIPMWSSDKKREQLYTFVKEYDVDVENSFAYGDTTGDFSMFENVGNPTTINPTKELIDKINSNDRVKDKIKIIVERKDVIYELPSNVKTVDISF